MLQGSHYRRLMHRGILAGILLCAAGGAGCRNADFVAGDDAAPTIQLTETLQVGDDTREAAVFFSAISAISVDRRGRIYVLDSRAPLVYVLSSDGDSLGVIGSEGEGPGEYRQPSAVVIGQSDSVYVFDNLPDRIMVYEPAAYEYAYGVTVEPEGEEHATSLMAARPEAFYVQFGLPPFLLGEDGMYVNEQTDDYVKRVAYSGVVVSEPLLSVANQNWVYALTENGGLSFVQVPFGRSGFIRTGPGGTFYYGENEAIRIQIMSSAGVPAGLIERDHTPVEVGFEEMEEVVADIEGAFRLIFDQKGIRHSTKPAYEDFIVDDHSRVWIKLEGVTDVPMAQWLVLDPSGRAVGRVELPSDVDLHVIKNGRAYGDSEGVEGAPVVIVYSVSGL